MSGYKLKVLIDTNVAMTFLTKRKDPFTEESKDVMLLCAKGEIDGYLAFHSLSTIWYLGRKLSEDDARRMLDTICRLLGIVGASQEEILEAVNNKEFKDFEDCLQDKCAKEAGCDYIVTANIKDFSTSEVKAVTPDEFLRIAATGEN